MTRSERSRAGAYAEYSGHRAPYQRACTTKSARANHGNGGVQRGRVAAGAKRVRAAQARTTRAAISRGRM